MNGRWNRGQRMYRHMKRPYPIIHIKGRKWVVREHHIACIRTTLHDSVQHQQSTLKGYQTSTGGSMVYSSIIINAEFIQWSSSHPIHPNKYTYHPHFFGSFFLIPLSSFHDNPALLSFTRISPNVLPACRCLFHSIFIIIYGLVRERCALLYTDMHSWGEEQGVWTMWLHSWFITSRMGREDDEGMCAWVEENCG